MAISISIADYISLKKLCHLHPSKPHIATAYRWSTRGIRGVRLTTYLVGGARMTTLADFDRFVAEVSAASDSATAQEQPLGESGNTRVGTTVTVTRSRHRQIARAEQDLDRRGVRVDQAAR